MKLFISLRLFALTLLCISTWVSQSAIAKVAPAAAQRNQALGTAQPSTYFGEWIYKKDSLITPELTNLATQDCLRTSQEYFDTFAYDKAKAVVDAMEAHYQRHSATTSQDKALGSLTRLLVELRDLPTPKAKGANAKYQKDCETLVSDFFKAEHTTFDVLYDGRINPKPVKALEQRGLLMSGLTDSGLVTQICKLEGYYSTSEEPKLWKLFSLTRALSNMLTQEADDAAFVAALEANANLIAPIRALDKYSAVAGRPNGPTLSMTAAERTAVGARTTGTAIGSKATSAMSFFTTGWRANLQELLLTRPYNATVPFLLLRVDEILASVEQTALEVAGKSASQSEHGMAAVFGSLGEKGDVLGSATQSYRRNAALAWLALNAETNVRQNELLGDVAAPIRPAPTTKVLGSKQYGEILKSISAAKAAYLTLVPAQELTNGCVSKIETMVQKASKIPVGKIEDLTAQEIEDALTGAIFPPVVVNIGGEINDAQDGKFNLHLGMGNGRTYKAVVSGSKTPWTVWTPTAFSLHLPGVMTTAEWSGVVDQYEKMAPTK